MVTFLIIYYAINIACGVGLMVYTAATGDTIEYGFGTFLFSTLVCVGLLLGVLAYL